jgi:hypothetical protein
MRFSDGQEPYLSILCFIRSVQGQVEQLNHLFDAGEDEGQAAQAKASKQAVGAFAFMKSPRQPARNTSGDHL